MFGMGSTLFDDVVHEALTQTVLPETTTSTANRPAATIHHIQQTAHGKLYQSLPSVILN